MHSRRLACFLLGLWLGGGWLLTWVSRENLFAADRIVTQSEPAATVRIKILGKEEARRLLQYEAAEMNRSEVEMWEIAQMMLGSVFFFFLLFGTTEGKFSLALALVLLFLVLAQRFVLTPELDSLGKMLDFSAPALLHGERTRYRIVNAAYLGVEIAKWSIQLLLMGLLLGRGRNRSAYAGK